MIVLDASAAVEWLLQSPRGKRVDALVEADPIVAAPHLVDVEVAGVLRRAVLSGALDANRAGLALDHLAQAPLRRFPMAPMLSRAWALRHNVSAYDAMYLVLAQTLRATLVTGDGRLLRAAEGSVAVAGV